MQLQGINRAEQFLGRFSRLALLVMLLIQLVACTTTPQEAQTTDYSHHSGEELLDIFLQKQRALASATLSFQVQVTVDNEKPDRLRGVAGFTHCADLRLKLVSAVGFTVLDYISIGDTDMLLVNKVTPEDDAAAEEGLFDTLKVFTSAFIGLCGKSGDFRVESSDEKSVSYRSETPGLEFTLDRQRATIQYQTLTGSSTPASTISYGAYDQAEKGWLPGVISIRSEDNPVLIELTVSQWRTNADLPQAFFDP